MHTSSVASILRSPCNLLNASLTCSAFIILFFSPQVIFGRDTDGSSAEPFVSGGEFDSLAAANAASNRSNSHVNIAFGRRRTEITERLRNTDARPNSGGPDGSVLLNRASTDLHMDNRMDRAFQAHEAAKRMDQHTLPNGLPKYGRRRYPLTLIASAQDLLQF